jgi:hypothetical protein
LFHKDLVITQLFCQAAVKFVITGFNDSECKIIFNKHYLQQQKLQLYESYISPDENFMVLRQNPIYATMYANEHVNVEGVILVKLNWKLFYLAKNPAQNRPESTFVLIFCESSLVCADKMHVRIFL